MLPVAREQTEKVTTSDGTYLQDVKARIAMAKQKMIQLINVWKDRSVLIHLKINLLKCLVWPVLMYGVRM